MLYITIPAIGSFPRIEITEEQSDLIKRAKTNIAHALLIEDKYDIIIQNYIDLQKALFSVSIEDSLFMANGVKSMFNQSRFISLRIINFLSACFLYMAQINRDVRNINPLLVDEIMKFKMEKRKVYRFRFMESLRNHTQHYGLPFFTSSNLRIKNIDEKRRVCFSTPISVSKTLLLLDSKIRRELPELKNEPEQIIINDYIDGFFEDIISIHKFIRDSISPIINVSRDTIDTFFQDYFKLWPKMAGEWQKVLGVSELVGKGFIFEFSRNNLDMLEELQNRNFYHENVVDRIISNKCP